MAFAAGVFTLVAGNPVVTGTVISSTWANNTLSDIATGLSTCLLKDGTQVATATVPFALGITIPAGKSLSGGGSAVVSTLTATGNASLLGGGSVFFNTVAFGMSTAAASVTNASTITTANFVITRVAAVTAITSVVLQAGTTTGQVAIVVNESPVLAADIITFAATGTSNVAGGANISISGGATKLFVWDSSSSLWY